MFVWRWGRWQCPVDDRCINGPFHKGLNHVPKAVSDRNSLPDWVRDLNYVRSQAVANANPNHITGSALIDPWMTSARISKMHTHKSRSERALRSHVLRIRLSMWITIQNAPFFGSFKSLIWKSFAFAKSKIRLSNQERVWITFQNGFRNVIRSFVNRPVIVAILGVTDLYWGDSS